jgi:phosphatidylglycerol phospholipase C
VPNVSFNMLQVLLMGPFGCAFIRKAKMLNREIFAWTVNKEKNMRWCIRRELDGVITDDPKKFLEVCDDYVAHAGRKERFSMREIANILRVHFFCFLITMLFRWKYGYGLDQRYVVRPKRIMEVEEDG